MRYQSFKHLLETQAEQNPEQNAFLYEENNEQKTCTYAQFLSLARFRKEELQKENIRAAGIYCDNSFNSVLDIFAANLAGIRLVLFSPNEDPTVLKDQIQSSNIDVILNDRNSETETKNKKIQNSSEDEKENSDQILFFTSGTTSASRAVVLSGYSLMQSAYNGEALLPLHKDDILLSILPMSHVFGFVCGLLWGLSAGSTIALGRGMRHYMDDFDYYKPTAVSLVPALLAFLFHRNLFNPRLKLILVGAGDCPDTLMEDVKAKGYTLAFGYGLTETSSGVALYTGTGDDPHAFTICPDDTISIAEDGEILIKAPTCMMQGYYEDKEAAEAVLKDGVLYTGDLGFLDEEGKLHVTGRKKEIILLSDGTKIFLPEYEAEIKSLLQDNEAAVLLIENRLTLVTEKEYEKKEVLETLKPFLDTKPRGQKITDVISLHHPLPKTATGKVKRWEIGEELTGRKEDR